MSVQGKEPQKYCGGKSPGVLNMGTHFVQLEYHTDGYGQSQGWSLRYTTQSICSFIHSFIVGKQWISEQLYYKSSNSCAANYSNFLTSFLKGYIVHIQAVLTMERSLRILTSTCTETTFMCAVSQDTRS